MTQALPLKQDAVSKKCTLIIVTASSFLTPFMGSAVNLAIPSIAKDLNGGAVILSWVVSSFILTSAVFLLPFGRFADIVGRKKVFVWGILVYALSSLLCALAWSTGALIIFRVLQGIGSAMLFSTGMAILTSVFSPQERGKVLGISTATVYLGLSLGPVLGGLLNHYLGWRSIFFFNAIIAAAVTLLTVAKLAGEWAEARGEKFDLTGACLYGIGFVAFLYGLSTLSRSAEARYLLPLGLVLIIVFVRWESRAANPIIEVNLLGRNITFAFSNLAALINYSATYAVSFLLSLHLQVVMGFDSQVAGLILLSQPAIMALLSPLAGMLSDRVEPRIVASWGMGLTSAGLFFLTLISRETPIGLVAANLALLGLGFALFSAPNTNAVMGSVERKYYGVASSMLGTMRLTGQATSMAIVTLIIAIYIGNGGLSPHYAELLVRSSKVSFAFFTCICLAGVLASLARGNIIQGPADGGRPRRLRI